jgi:hypothetical protein
MSHTTVPHYVYAIYNTAGIIVKCGVTTVSTVPYNGHEDKDVRIKAIVTNRETANSLLEILKRDGSLDKHVAEIQRPGTFAQ